MFKICRAIETIDFGTRLKYLVLSGLLLVGENLVVNSSLAGILGDEFLEPRGIGEEECVLWVFGFPGDVIDLVKFMLGSLVWISANGML